MTTETVRKVMRPTAPFWVGIGGRRWRLGAPAALSLITLLALAGAAAASPRGEFKELPIPTAGSNPYGIAVGPDGNLWLAELHANKIARVTPAGSITEFELPPHAKSEPEDLTVGAEGNLWFTEYEGNRIGRITPTGVISEFEVPTAEAGPYRLTLGPEGNVWFVENKKDKIGRLNVGEVVPGTTTGITEFPLAPASNPTAIAAGPDGNLWFPMSAADKIGRITPSGTVSEFNVPTAEAEPEDITEGPDGNMWFTEFGTKGNGVGRIRISEASPGTSNGITEFPLAAAVSRPEWITTGADGNLWFSETGKNKVGVISPAGELAGFELPTAGAVPSGMTQGPDGNMWFTEYVGDKVASVGTGAPGALVSGPTVSGAGIAGTAQACTSATWSTWASLQPPEALFGFDRYSWQVDGAQIATGPSYVPTAPQVGHKLTCSQTVTYPLPFLTTAVATSAPVAVATPPAAPARPAAPTITEARQSVSRWREGNKLARISKKKPPVGTTFSFALNEPASVSFRFTQRVQGRKVGLRCVAPTKRNRKREGCKRTVTLGMLTFTGHQGSNKVVFQGRLSPSRKLKPGRYTLVIEAVSSTGHSAPARLTFTVVK